MKKNKFYKFLLLKAYFDKGIGLTSYAKYLIALLGFYSWATKINLNYMLFVGIFYIIFCFFLGWLWFKYRIIDTENEIQNIFNPFQREVRKKLNGKRFK